ncbi:MULTISPECIES: TolC family protein [Rhodonellum]|nr:MULTISPECIES: TolC family protein [Rhodonellum]SDZ39298.1 cobalt-zinc-cadmium resistance protein CzcA [Rhodonellum ikkaensis]
MKTYKLTIGVLVISVGLSLNAFGQSVTIDLQQAIDAALANNIGLKAQEKMVQSSRALIPTGFNIEKTQAFYRHDQNDIAENGFSNSVLGISQNLQFPTVYGFQKKINQDRFRMQQQKYEISKIQVVKEVSKAYYSIVYWKNLQANYQYLDSLYRQFSIASSRRFELGETNYLEKITAQSKQREIGVQLAQAIESEKNAYMVLEQWIQMDGLVQVGDIQLRKLNVEIIDVDAHPGVVFYENAVKMSEHAIGLEQHKLLPDLFAEVFRGTNSGANSKVYPGFQVGVSLPLWFGAQKAKIGSARTDREQSQLDNKNFVFQLENRTEQLTIELKKYMEAIDFYEQEGKELSDQLIKQASEAFKNGEIDFLQYVLLIENSRNIQVSYLQNLNLYNMTVLEINYLMNP